MSKVNRKNFQILWVKLPIAVCSLGILGTRSHELV